MNTIVVRFLFYGVSVDSNIDWSVIFQMIRDGLKETVTDFFDEYDPFNPEVLKSLKRTKVGLTSKPFALPMPALENGIFKSYIGRSGVAIDMSILVEPQDSYLLHIIEQSVIGLYCNTEVCRDYVLETAEEDLEEFEFNVFIPINHVAATNISTASLN